MLLGTQKVPQQRPPSFLYASYCLPIETHILLSVFSHAGTDEESRSRADAALSKRSHSVAWEIREDGEKKARHCCIKPVWAVGQSPDSGCCFALCGACSYIGLYTGQELYTVYYGKQAKQAQMTVYSGIIMRSLITAPGLLTPRRIEGK